MSAFVVSVLSCSPNVVVGSANVLVEPDGGPRYSSVINIPGGSYDNLGS